MKPQFGGTNEWRSPTPTARTDGRGGTETSELTPSKAIKQHCKECFGFFANEVKGCTSPLCALYPFRLGGTGVRRNYTAAQREEMQRRGRELAARTNNSSEKPD